MHGQRRLLREKTDEEKKEEQLKAAKLEKAGVAVLAIIHKKDYSPESFMLTSVLAKLNPDFYTIWNYRKDYLLLQLNDEVLQESSKLDLLEKEMKLTEDIIQNKDPKCYGVWHHRRWLFGQNHDLLVPRELKLCEMLLKKDQRNFHCWNHWMLVCHEMNVSIEDQMAFTWQRILENSSNYSAWHFRGQLLNQLIMEKYPNDAAKCVELLKAELEVNLTALYTECDDQSSWYYMRTLFTIIQDLVTKNILAADTGKSLLDERKEAITELLEVEPDCIYGEDFLSELNEIKM